MVTGGNRAAQGGSFFEPTVLTDVTTDMVITKACVAEPSKKAALCELVHTPLLIRMVSFAADL
ncbi:MAG TPA: hypothetical protein VNZ53_13300 [Steroidobacteraceae bacterium]|nr:hypothetical protein [Steroidobacteraceae bacterium]